MNFIKSLGTAWEKNNSLLCVGLDPDPAKFPAHLKGRPDAILEFCKSIADATADLVCCFKNSLVDWSTSRRRILLRSQAILLSPRPNCDMICGRL